MNTITSPRISRFFFIFLAVFALVGMFSTSTAEARRYLVETSGGINGEGDPLDGNDYSTGGGGLIGDHVHENASMIDSPPGGVIISGRMAESLIFVIVDFQGRIPVLRFVQISSSAVTLEGPDAR